MGDSPTLRPIDSTTLRDVVRRVTGCSTAEVIRWEIAPLVEGMSNAGVYQLTGDAQAAGRSVPWTVVLKTLRRDPEHADPTGWAYWKREALLYASGALDHLPAGLRAARCFAVDEHPLDTVWLWLEALSNPPAVPAPRSRYATVARGLGTFNGAYLMEWPLPSAPWLPVSWLRAHVATRAEAVAVLARHRDHPLVRRIWPPSNVAGILRLWEERLVLLDALDRLPRTFCHRDATLRNLFLPTGDLANGAVAIDWAFAGPGAVGEDPASLLHGTLALYEVAPHEAADVDHAVFSGYLEGLTPVGWKGDRRLPRLGYTASIALRTALGFAANNVPALLRLTEEQLEASCQAAHGRSLTEMQELSAALVAFALRLGNEARQLVHDLK